MQNFLHLQGAARDESVEQCGAMGGGEEDEIHCAVSSS